MNRKYTKKVLWIKSLFRILLSHKMSHIFIDLIKKSLLFKVYFIYYIIFGIMILWNKKKLIKKLQDGLSERENFMYLLLYNFTIAVLLFSPFLDAKMGIVYGYYDVIITIVLSFFLFFSTYYLYTINKKDFLSRYLAITFVATIRSIVFVLPISFIIYILSLIFLYWENIPLQTTVCEVLLVVSYLIGVWFLMRKYFLELNK